jgi:hypothetical protein
MKNHDEYLEKYKLEMSMQTSDAPMEETEETTEVVEETADPLLNLFQPTDALSSDKAVTTLFTPERPEGIMTAAKGGRVAFQGGGRDASQDDFGGSTNSNDDDKGGETNREKGIRESYHRSC